jgi:hypothetical protein
MLASITRQVKTITFRNSGTHDFFAEVCSLNILLIRSEMGNLPHLKLLPQCKFIIPP